MQRVTVILLVVFMASLSFAQGKSGSPDAAKTGKPAAAAATSSTGESAAADLPTEATVDSFLKYMFGYDPSVQWKVLAIKPAEARDVAEVTLGIRSEEGQQRVRFYVMPGGKWAVAGDMVPFGADPFAPARAELEAKAHGPARGSADATVNIVEFSDLQCPSCKAAQPTIDRLLTDVPNAHFIFQNFPLETMHPWAFKAATYADCIGRQNNEAFWKFVSATYDNQEQITPENADEKLKSLAEQSGVHGDQAASCAAQPATAERVRQSEALGNALDVNGTPTLFVNGRKIPNLTGLPYEMLKALVTGTPK